VRTRRRPDDPAVEGLRLAADPEDPFDGATEVRGCHDLARRIADAGAKLEGVDLPTVGGPGDGHRQVRHDGRPAWPAHLLERHQAVVRGAEDVPAVDTVRDRRVDGIELRALRVEHRYGAAPVAGARPGRGDPQR